MIRRLLVVALVLLAGCSTATRTATPVTPSATLTTVSATTTTVDYPALQRQYLAAVAPAQSALAAFQAADAKLPDTATGPQLAAVAAPLADALDRSSAALLAIQAPPAVTTDIRALATGYAVVEGDLRGFVGMNALNSGTLLSAFAGDVVRERPLANIVRADLHLPPLPPVST